MSQADSAHSTPAPGGANVPTDTPKPSRHRCTGISPATPPQAPIDPAQAAIDAVMTMIARAADAGQVDVVERLLAWRDEQIALKAELAFKTAMASAQEEMAPIRADMLNPETDSRYGSLEAVDEVIRKVYTAHGFSPTFDTEDTSDPLAIRVICDLNHRDGHCRRYSLPMPCDGKGPKGNPVMSRIHATGSALTYGRRYLLCNIFNLVVSKKQDDDGNAAGRRPHVNRHTPTYDQAMPPQGNPTTALQPKHRLEDAYNPHPADRRPMPRKGPACSKCGGTGVFRRGKFEGPCFTCQPSQGGQR